MLKKTALVIVLIIVFTGVENLIAEQKNSDSAQFPPNRQRSMREGFDKWLNELTEAHEKNDREKVTQLLEQMKQNRQRMRERRESRGEHREGRGRGMDRDGRRRPPEGQDIPRGQGRRPALSSEAEAKILSVLEDIHENQRRGMMNVSRENGRLLRLLTAAANAKHVVEIGTSNGYSGIWFCLGLRATGGRLTTHEIDAGRAALARENFKRAGVEQIVTLVEGDAHKEVTKLKGPIDIVFIDADKAGYIDYLNKVLPLVRPGGLILAHNTTNTGPQMQDYLTAVTTKPDLETIFLHKDDRGFGVTLKKRQSK